MDSRAIILAGGVGSRLWPLSRDEYPKQFIKFFNDDSLFQKSVKRLTPIFGKEKLLISTNEKYRFIIKNQLKELNLEINSDQIIVEPEHKGTLSAVLLCMHKGGQGKYGVFPSDHEMKGQKLFEDSINAARHLARENIISFGIVPNKPHTGYGYIKPGAPLDGGFKVDRFIEKPSFDLAKKYVDAGYFWNAGMLFTNSKVFLNEVQTYSPEHLAIHERGEEAYKTIPNMTMEYGVMEKTDRAAVVPIKSYWNDLGSFSSFFDVREGQKKVLTNTEVLNIDSKHNLVLSDEKKLVGLINVENLVIVDTRDALLIGSKNSSQKVKELVTYLKKHNDKRALFHTTVHRPWGHSIIMEENGGYRIKRLFVFPGKRLTTQRHFNRSEHWVVVKGTAKVIMDEKEFVLGPGESNFVPIGTAHRVENPGKIPLELIEVQIGEYLEENDIERVNGDSIE